MQEIIDRNLFERYGDVQAFALNREAHVQLKTIDPFMQRGLVSTLNQYITTYGCYDLSMIVDPDGKIVAINTKGPKGEDIK